MIISAVTEHTSCLFVGKNSTKVYRKGKNMKVHLHYTPNSIGKL